MHPVLSVTHALLVIVAAFLGAIVIVGFSESALQGLGVATESLAGQAVLMALQFVGFGLGVAGYFSITDRWDLIDIRTPTLRDLTWVLGGLLAILFAAQALSFLLSLLGVSVAQNQVVVAGKENPRYFLYMVPVTLLFVGPFEELVFRGTVQGLLRETWDPEIAIPVASLLFGFAHWLALTGGGSRLPYVLVAGVLALILGIAYEYTDNLLVPATIHGGYNAVLFLVQYAIATGAV